MTVVAVVGALIFGLMLAELRVSQRHERSLCEQGAIRPAGDPYAALAVTYPAAFLAMVIEGLLRAPGGPAQGGGPNWFLSGVLLFAVSKGLKYWAIGALGTRWTFKVHVLPGRPLVSTGPYRYVAHPNYIALIGELAGAAMMCGAPAAGVIGSAAFGIALWRRIRFERSILAQVEGESGR